jgi:hypothetical protein
LITAYNKTIASGQTLVFDTPTTTDASGTAIVQIVGMTTNMLADGSYTVTCTWCATDACGNMCGTKSQTITVAAPVVSVPALQRLTISATGANGILLRWPTNAADYRLESSPTTTAKRWYPVPVTPVSTNGEFQVTLPVTGPSQFFRLSDAPPMLELSASAGTVHLAWPTAPSGFQLESSDTMLPGNWAPMLITPATSNGFNYVDLPLRRAIAGKLFRLKK